MDLVGKKMGRLTVLRESDRKGYYMCQCDCGKMKEINGYCLTRKKSPIVSCGCYRSEKARKIGEKTIHPNSKTRLSIVSKYGVNYNYILNDKPPKNNTSGYQGVCYVAKRDVYVAYIGYQGKQIYLGTYKDINSAVEARHEAEEKYYSPIMHDLAADVAKSFPKKKGVVLSES